MSEIRVDTISEKTSANGVSIDGVTLKDGALTASGIVKTDDTTNATSTTDGSLQTDGGLSVVLDAVIGDDLFMKSDAAVIHFGADSDVTLTHVADKGLTLSTATGDDSLILQSTLADNNSAPRLKLHRASSSPADNDLLGAITWSFLDDGGNSHEAAFIRATATDVSNGSEDATLEVNVDVAGSNINRLSFNAVEAVFNEGSADIDFRVESNGNANMFTINAGTDKVGIGDNPDLGLLHVKSADTGASVSGDADELVIENSRAGMSFLSATDNYGIINFGDSGDNNIGQILYYHGDNSLSFVNNAQTGIKIDGSGAVTKPLQPAFLGINSAQQSDIADGHVLIDIDTEIFDQNADFNTGTHTFTAPVTGKYAFMVNITVSDLATNYQWVYCYIGTSNRTAFVSTIDPRSLATASGYSLGGSILIDMDANDTALLYFRSSAHGDNTVNIVSAGTTNPETYFSGYLVA